MQKEGHHSVSLWVVAFALIAGLQVFRGSLGDTVIFSLGTLVIAWSGFVPHRWDLPTNHLISNRILSFCFVVLGIGVALLPKHSVPMALVFLALAPLALALAWGTHRGPKGKASLKIKRARVLWVSWATLTCIWEFAANILGQLNNTHTAYPTISILIVPFLDSSLGQAAFVAVWILVGLSLIRVGRRP